jgi:hypothetical protein
MRHDFLLRIIFGHAIDHQNFQVKVRRGLGLQGLQRCLNEATFVEHRHHNRNAKTRSRTWKTSGMASLIHNFFPHATNARTDQRAAGGTGRKVIPSD